MLSDIRLRYALPQDAAHCGRWHSCRPASGCAGASGGPPTSFCSKATIARPLSGCVCQFGGAENKAPDADAHVSCVLTWIWACDGMQAHTSANGTMCRPGSAAAGADGGRPITSPRRKASAISASAASTACRPAERDVAAELEVAWFSVQGSVCPTCRKQFPG